MSRNSNLNRVNDFDNDDIPAISALLGCYQGFVNRDGKIDTLNGRGALIQNMVGYIPNSLTELT